MIGNLRARWPIGAILVGLTLTCLSANPAWGEEPATALSAVFRSAAVRVRPSLVAIRPADGFPLSQPILGARPAPVFSPDLNVPVVSFTGLIVDPEKGYILTAEAPTEGPTRFVVTFADGRERATAEIRRDRWSGLALLAADMRDLPHPQPSWGDPSQLEPGDWLIGLGRFVPGEPSISAGIFSARRRASGFDWLETDAIGRLGSGAVLVNLQGEVVGIGQPIRRRPDGSEALGHAVPADRARRVADDLGRYGEVRRGYLGVSVEPAEPSAGRHGLRVVSVRPDSPAADARMEPGDLILAVDGREVNGIAALQDAVESAPIGQERTLSVIRQGGRRMEIKVRTRAMPTPGGPVRPAPPDRVIPPTLEPPPEDSSARQEP